MCEVNEVVFDEGDKIDAAMREMTEEQQREMLEESAAYFATVWF